MSPFQYAYTTCNTKKNYSFLSLWKEFVELWNITNNTSSAFRIYTHLNNEFLHNIIQCDQTEQAWYDFLTQSNYHSFDSYSVYHKYEIINEWTRNTAL